MKNTIFNKVVLGIKRTFEVLAVRKNLSFALEYSDDISEELIGDGKRIRQILVNLIGNAMKFTENGKVNITVWPKELNNDSNYSTICFKVSDTGVGITAEQSKSIFNVFTQADTSTSRKYGGSGLGLAISKNLVTIMGGELSVESEVGVGSSFSFELKLVDHSKNGEYLLPLPRQIYNEVFSLCASIQE